MAEQSHDRADVALFAGGCFWGVEDVFRHVKGVIKTSVGYSGGQAAQPSYKQVCSGTTGHAETVRVEFDPAQASYRQLLDAFWENHDPTTPNRQGLDVGTQYRSAIFYLNDQQKREAEESKARLAASGRYGRPIVTEITPASEFWMAEDYHQQYFEKRGISHCEI
ncbi:MAG: peptide-methionine (S)-S-oxide reductase MsrA [Chloroflexota bacterium]|nr:peptide-methionine (S)-S-oxide reductase MsrA [Chloroflexota bacterium]